LRWPVCGQLDEKVSELRDKIASDCAVYSSAKSAFPPRPQPIVTPARGSWRRGGGERREEDEGWIQRVAWSHASPCPPPSLPRRPSSSNRTCRSEGCRLGVKLSAITGPVTTAAVHLFFVPWCKTSTASADGWLTEAAPAAASSSSDGEGAVRASGPQGRDEGSKREGSAGDRRIRSLGWRPSHPATTDSAGAALLAEGMLPPAS
jgi:hypothetical protein